MPITNKIGTKNSEIVQAALTESRLDSFSDSRLQILSALIFGVVLIAIVGLAPMEVLHNAAHDVRHVFVFPCH
ncbi:MAG: CbtB domain-containing protein [Thiohalomonadales bacterium]